LVADTLSVACPICGYNQGEEGILVAHLVRVHGGIPHVQGEEMVVCNDHPGVAPMNRLEFLKHTQEVTSTDAYGRPLSKCHPTPLSQGQVVSMPLKEWQSIALGKTHPAEKPLKLRWGSSIASSGAVLMILNAASFIPLADLELSLYGWVQMLAGFAILAGSAVFYSNQSRYKQGSAIALVAASISWVAVLLIIARVLSGTAYVRGVLIIFLLLAPLLSTIVAAWNLLSKNPNPQSRNKP
jgi:hypothetical protein